MEHLCENCDFQKKQEFLMFFIKNEGPRGHFKVRGVIFEAWGASRSSFLRTWATCEATWEVMGNHLGPLGEPKGSFWEPKGVKKQCRELGF